MSQRGRWDNEECDGQIAEGCDHESVVIHESNELRQAVCRLSEHVASWCNG